MFHQFVVWLAHAVGQWGYPGIVLPHGPGILLFSVSQRGGDPAGRAAAYLATTGEMTIAMILLTARPS